jgi:hypothetical protein
MAKHRHNINEEGRSNEDFGPETVLGV